MFTYPAADGREVRLPFVIGVLSQMTATPPASIRESGFVPALERHPLARVFPHAQIRILDCTKQSLCRDVLRAANHDQTGLFKLVHDNIFGVLGTTPFALLVSDFVFDSSPPDLKALELISRISADIHAPFVASAAETGRFDKSPKWQSVRRSEEASYLALTAPPSTAWNFPIEPNEAEPDENAQRGFLSNSPMTVAASGPSLPAVLELSRVAHYVKAYVRDSRFESPAECERALRSWIGRYVGPGRPLASAHVRVEPPQIILRVHPASRLFAGLPYSPRIIVRGVF